MIKKTKIKIISFMLAALGAIITPAIIPSDDASALAGNVDDLVNIALLDGLFLCYKNDHVKSSGIQLEDFNSRGYMAIWGSKSDKDGTVLVPTMVGNTLSDADVSCEQVLAGYKENKASNSIKGLNSRFTKSSDPKFYGYVPDNDKNAQEAGDEDSQQIKITLGVSDGSGNSSIPSNSTGELVCDGTRKYHNGWINKYYYWQIGKCSGNARVEYSRDNSIYFEVMGGDPVVTNVWAGDASVYLPWSVDHFRLHNTITIDSQGVSFQDAFNQSDIYRYLKEDVQYTFAAGMVYSEPVASVNVTTVSSQTIGDGTNVNSWYKWLGGNASAASGVAVYNIVGGTDRDYLIRGWVSTADGSGDTFDAWWPKAYTYHLYYEYLKGVIEDDLYKGHVTIGKCGSGKPTTTNYYLKNSADSWCEINIDATGQGSFSKSLNIVGSSGHLEKGTFGDILEWFKDESNYGNFKDDDYLNAQVSDDDDNTSMIDPSVPDPGEEITEKTDECYANAGALGWIMCPVIKALSSVMDWAYQTVEKNFLLVEVQESFSVGSATYKAWDIIRNIANVAFAVLLLVVIFSQITGFGIDNYGIKRVLPRLIIAVILVNLSFIICQLLVDLSNIVGVSLKNMMEGFVPQVGGAGAGAHPLAVFAAGTVDVALTAAIVAGVAMFSSSGGVGIILALLLGLLAIVIGILFLFIILITRHAALIMLAIISPLAFVCYMLPNTEKLFKRWVDAGKGLLLLYPICAIVVGGGKFAGAVLSNIGSNGGGWIYNFAAMLIQVAPYFLIPSLLRGSLKGIGNIGEKINGLGRNLSRTARGSLDRAARNSNLMKDAQERQLDRKIMRGANARLRRVAERESGIRGYLPGGRKRDKNGNYIIDEKRLANQSVARKKQIANAAATVAGNNEKVVSAQASMATKNLSESAIDARAKGFEEAEVEKAIKDQEALIKATDDFKANNYAELEKQYLAAAKDGNVNKARAYHNLMMGTDAGRKALMNGFSQVLRSSDVSAATKNAIRNDLRGDKHSAVLKNTVRSMFNEVTSNKDTSALNAAVFDTSGSTLNTDSVNVNNYAPESLAGADDSEIAKLQQYVAQNASSTDADVQANVRRIAQLVQETSEAGHAGRLKVKEGNQAIFDKITATAAAAGGTSGFDPQWRDKVTVKINGTDYSVYKVPDGFGSAKISIDGSGHVIYRNAQGNKFDATNNTIKP